MWIRITTGIVSAFIISLYATLINHTPVSERIEGVYYYSFERLFSYGTFYLSLIYLLVGVPLSLVIDHFLRPLRTKLLSKILIRMILYLLFGSLALMAVVRLASTVQSIDWFKVLASGMFGSLIFFIVLVLIELLILKIKKL